MSQLLTRLWLMPRLRAKADTPPAAWIAVLSSFMVSHFITFVIWLQHKCIVMIAEVDTIAERLKQARKEKGWTQGQLATASDVSQGTIGNIESGKRQALASLVNICRALGVNYDWMVSGTGPKHVHEDVAHRASDHRATYLAGDPEFPSIRRVTLKLQAGMTGFVVDADPEEAAPIMFRRDWFESRGYVPEKLVAFRVKGSSMEPVLFDGDTVVANTAQTEPKDGVVFAVNYEGEAIVKRLVRDAGQWWLCSDNPDNARFPRKVANHTAILIGEVVHRQSERI